MDKIRVLLSLWAVGLLLSNCTTATSMYETELDQVDSLRTVVNGYLQFLDSVDTPENTEIAGHVASQYAIVKNNYPDQEDRDFWLKQVPQFGNINKALGRLESNKTQFRSDLEYTDKQLLTLANSIRDEQLDSAKIKEYLEVEERAVSNLGMVFRKHIRPSKLALEMWAYNQEPYDSIADHWQMVQ